MYPSLQICIQSTPELSWGLREGDKEAEGRADREADRGAADRGADCTLMPTEINQSIRKLDAKQMNYFLLKLDANGNQQLI